MHVPTPSHDAEPEASGDPSVGRARTCVGCGEPEPLSSARAAGGKLAKLALRPLVRLLLGPGGEIAVDTGARGKTAGFGRGAYVHAEPRCIAAAAQRGLLRAAKGPALMGGERVTAQGLTRAITEAYERRSLSLLSTAKRAGKLDVGSSRVVESTRRGHAHLVIVATDAAAAADMFEVRDAVSAGRALAWGSKQELAARLGGAAYSEGVGVVAVTDTRIAGALLESRRIVDALASGPAARAPVAAPRRSRSDAADGGPQQSRPSGRPSAGASSPSDASILVGGAANLRGPARPGTVEPHARSRGGSRRRGVKSA
jgi:predicted RNA-binding protein YlxR (DUF448 family)